MVTPAPAAMMMTTTRVAAAMEAAMEEATLDDVIRRLQEGGRSGKQVKLSEAEIRGLCVEGRKTFLSQPNLLRLRAPIKICGELFFFFFFYFLFLRVHAILIGLEIDRRYSRSI